MVEHSPQQVPGGGVPPDWELSPRTGWSRDHWVALADHLLASAQAYASPGHGQIIMPGDEGGYGRAVDGLEGFARTFLLAGFRLAGAENDPANLAEWYAAGLAEGTDPASPHRWVRPTEHPQAKVEAASLALVLDLTRATIWDRLPAAVQARIIDYLSPIVGDTTFPRNNWLWFRIVVETFLRSVGGPWSGEDIEQDLALHDSFIRADGWLADGEGRDYDHYVGWALHLYPTLWQRMRGASDLADDARRQRDRAGLDRYLCDAISLIGADGAPLIQGRSLIYRFAAAACFWVGAMAEVPSLSPGRLRRAASGIVGYFARHGVPDQRGLLTMGWHGPWRRLAQSYSGPGSPYWAAKGMLGLALPATHPVWTAVEEALPVEDGDVMRAIAAPGWLVSATRADGIVRVVNHGTDHARDGQPTGDSPLYARLGYSTATFPLLDDEAWRSPLDQSVGLVDAAGRVSHRAGWHLEQVTVFDDSAAAAADDAGQGAMAVGLAVSSGPVHWLVPDETGPRHGSGLPGLVSPAGSMTVLSLVRGAWEVRGVRLDDLDQAAGEVILRVGGWPVASPDDGQHPGAGLVSRIRPLGGPGRAGLAERTDASPLGGLTGVPYLDFPARIGQWVWSLIELSASSGPVFDSAQAAIVGDDSNVAVTWPDGRKTTTALPRPPLCGLTPTPRADMQRSN